MHIFKIVIISCILLVCLTTCTVFKKEIKKPVTVSLIGSVSPSIWKNSNYNKYVVLHSPEEISTSFLKGFEAEANSTKNVSLSYNNENADFVLSVKLLSITESSKVETINDSKSPYNGQQIELNTVDCSVQITIVNTKNKTKHLMDCSDIKSRSEKVKNNRDLGDLITGSNKDRTRYRTKLLSDNICVSLAEDVGRRVWVPITRRISKNLK
ncbi:MAG: hypothetical protein SFY56_01530 [Bacteroidota bacterium]|nr:hypothetical protein [Bacteroidota bacterium]